MIRNPEWYDLNEQIAWPLTDAATQLSDKGQRLPTNILADLNIWFPNTIGSKLYVSSVTVSKKIATVTFVADNMGVRTAAAAVTVTTPMAAYRHYPVTALYPGVAGWVVFGSAINDGVSYSYRFSTSAQSELLPQIARAYKSIPVTSAGKYGLAEKLTGIIRLEGGDDIEIVKEEREIADVLRTVAVIRLKNKPQSDQSLSVFEKYAGTCGNRPESNNCITRPIEFINSVAPDCCGNINIAFRGCTDLRFIQNESCSVAIGCNIGLSEACITPDRLPTHDGILPNVYNDLCVEESIMSSADLISSGSPSSVAPTFVARTMTAEDTDNRLPYTEDFSDQTAQDFKALTGKFAIVADTELPLYGGYSLQSVPVGRAMALWQYGIPETSWYTGFKKATLHFSMRKGPSGVLHNAGLVFNSARNGQIFWAVEIDHEGTFTGQKCLRLARYSGGVSTTFAVVALPVTELNRQYKLELTLIPDDSAAMWLTATLTNNADIGSPTYVDETLGPFMLADYGSGNTLFGVTAYQSVTQFNRLVVDNVIV
jgi:hypothetical protein